MNNKFNNFHMVDPSPWPIYMSLILMSALISTFYSMSTTLSWGLFISLLMCFMIFFLWSRDVVRESLLQGNHTYKVISSIKFGMILFILSEVMFFFSFFWTFFHSSLNPSNEVGNMWPCWGVEAINPFTIPLLNTLILVSSGVTITYSHHMMLNQNFDLSFKWIMLTIFLGLYFTMLQFLEYKYSTFTIMDSIYGSIFFLATGFHGLHVIVGSLMIMFSMIRLFNFHFSSKHHLIYEFSCWYWHFVDLVWLFLYIFIYWWGI
uniref:Cytochrome c oxidase subunit 3 n=1 Tax=Liposcelis sculptilimacula TaxID=1899352 RepID=A0A191ZS54_9NEOP|nr:cytochrome c oxidase subunit III [Liposcelis keleri]ANJ70938.1 cytochrome c oxidase subunit III [Liposcelis sculptilimacula]